MPQSVAVTGGRAAPVGAAMHPTTAPPPYRRRLARLPVPGPGVASGCLVHA
jgi:hypothetical protein